jgi:hypothetical protein
MGASKLHRRTRASSLAGLLLAWLSLCGQLGGYAHLAFTRHVTCLEHGELVHVGEPRLTSEATPLVTSEATPRQARLAAAPAAEHGHDHCLTAALRRERPAPSSAAPMLVSAPATPLVLSRAASLAPPSPIALLSAAPKTSPPA